MSPHGGFYAALSVSCACRDRNRCLVFSPPRTIAVVAFADPSCIVCRCDRSLSFVPVYHVSLSFAKEKGDRAKALLRIYDPRYDGLADATFSHPYQADGNRAFAK